ncbi:hypothetical protein FA13DRAFT_1311214 [Coprinellus micaceus]|uniref:Uncharacterized protein n=1 Tax=Coprinellus micaceus TaxID=71717 RepID=A0A4Y7SS55_COPMI|nr:hypothetical protein FA13DRAFT_1311214 [Coprinellus micaceus]
MGAQTRVDRLCAAVNSLSSFKDQLQYLASFAHQRISILFRFRIPSLDFIQGLIPEDESAVKIILEALELLEFYTKRYSASSTKPLVGASRSRSSHARAKAWFGLTLRTRIYLAFAEAYALHVKRKGHKPAVCTCDPCFMSGEMFERVLRYPLDRVDAQLRRNDKPGPLELTGRIAPQNVQATAKHVRDVSLLPEVPCWPSTSNTNDSWACRRR